MVAACASSTGSTSAPDGGGVSKTSPEIYHGEAESLFPGDPVLSIRFARQLSPQSTLRTTSGTRLAAEAAALDLKGRARQEALPGGRRLVEVTGLQGIEASQETLSWCWAACVQMVLMHAEELPEGAPLEQKEIARHFHGEDRISGADQAILIRALAPEVELEITNNGFDFGADLRVLGVDPLLEALARGEMVVTGLRSPESAVGHICVITGAVFAEIEVNETEQQVTKSILDGLERRVSWGSEARDGLEDMRAQSCSKYALEELRIIDPWPGKGAQTMSAEEFRKSCDFFLSQSMAREILSTDFNSLRLTEKAADRVSEKLEGLLDGAPWR